MSNEARLIPEGFVEMPNAKGFAKHVGPFYLKDLGGRRFTYGFVSKDHHENPNDVLHGGMLSTFADHFLGHAVVYVTGRYCATISLNTDYAAGGKVGRFIEGRAEIVRQTNSLMFMRGVVHDGDDILLNVNGVWRLFGEYAGAGSADR